MRHGDNKWSREVAILFKDNTVAVSPGRGAAKDYSEYQKLCGTIQGLAIAERYIIDLAEKVEKSDE